MAERIEKLRWPLHAAEAIANFTGSANSPRQPACLGTVFKNLGTVPAEWNCRNNVAGVRFAWLSVKPVTAGTLAEHSFRGKSWYVHFTPPPEFG